jgi:ATP-dependent Clp protease ATP-binding subunit ClpA
LGFQRVLQRAVFHVQSSGKKEVLGANVLVAIFSEQESQSVYFLKKQNINRLDIVNFISHGISKNSDDSNDDNAEQATTPKMKIVILRPKVHWSLMPLI